MKGGEEMAPEGDQGQDTEQRNRGKSWVKGFPRLYGQALLVYVEVNHFSSASLSGYCGSVTPSIQTATSQSVQKSQIIQFHYNIFLFTIFFYCPLLCLVTNEASVNFFFISLIARTENYFKILKDAKHWVFLANN